MADKYLLEDGSGGYTLEDGSGYYLLENAFTDNFDDNSRDTSKWNLGLTGWTGITNNGISETNGRVEVLPPAGTTDGGGGYESVNSYDITGGSIYLNVQASGTLSIGQEVHFGFRSASDGYFIFRDNTTLYLYRRVAGANTSVGSVAYSATTHRWWRLRHNSADDTVHLETATSTAANPPASGDWTSRASETWNASVPKTNKISFGSSNWQNVATPRTIYFDDFNTAFATSSPANITATASPSLSTFLSTSAAKALVEGVGAGTINSFGSSGLGKARVKAAASVAPRPFTASAAGVVRVKGAGSVSLSPFISAAAARAVIEGVGSGTLNTFGLSAAGRARVKATAAPALGALDGAATASSPVRGTANIAVSSFLSASAAAVLVEGAGSGALNAFASAAAVRIRISAAAAASLQAFTTTGTADVVQSGISASASPVLAPFASAAAMRALVEGVGGGALNPFAAAASARVRAGANAVAILDGFSTAASARVRIGASASIEIGEVTAVSALRKLVPTPVPARRVGMAAAEERGALVEAESRVGAAARAARSLSVSRARRAA
ncbi:MAG TPA: hypothetical protein VIL42_10650 [Sphingomicrobium sp.]|jgi:hypothetical protein